MQLDFSTLPNTPEALFKWDWPDFEPYVGQLKDFPLSAQTAEMWLSAWSRLEECFEEFYCRLEVATTTHTDDVQAEERMNHYIDVIFPQAMQANQDLKQKLLASGLQVAGFDQQLARMREDAEIFRAENLPLLGQEEKYTSEYNKIVGAQSVLWDGEEKTLTQLDPVLLEQDRARREKAWRLAAERRLADRQSLNELWQKEVSLRASMAAQAGFSSYRDYRWKNLHRFDYTPADSQQFRDAIEAVVVPAASRIYARRKQNLGLQTLRPWDMDVDPLGRAPLKPFTQVEDLITHTASIFRQVDPALGGYFGIMVQEGLLDLDNRKNKAPGGYCTSFAVQRRPFIFMNAVGIHDNVQTLLHEGGHSFHVFESAHLPYVQQLEPPMEFAEVASMGMELLAAPYLSVAQGGFYTPGEAARARIEHLESSILFWPYMAVVDGFQHWVYENQEAASDPAACDACWGALWARFMPDVDWSGLEEVRLTGWQRKLHIFCYPFYYIEYGLAQLGAVQIWRNALSDQAAAVAAYRRALALGGTVSLPALFAAAGVRFALDAQTLQEAVLTMETVLEQLRQAA